MKNNFPALALSVLIVTPVFAYQFSPTPKAGLWLHESRALIGNVDSPQTLDEAALHLPQTTAEYRALLAEAISETSPIITMECFTPSQVDELVQIDSLQLEMQRKVPECELTVHPLDRSTLNVYGNCNANHGFHGEMHGYVEFITSHQFQVTFLGEALVPTTPHETNSQTRETNSQTRETSLHRNETYRWSTADCGDLQPQERLSF